MPEVLAAIPEDNTKPLIEQALSDEGLGQSVIYLKSIDELASRLEGSEKAKPPRLILLELELNGQIAWELLEKKRDNKKWAGIPVLVLTRDINPAVRHYLQQLEAEVLVRPFLGKTLKDKLRELANT